MSALEPSGVRQGDREGKEGCRRAVSGLTLGGEQTVVRVASLCVCETRRGIGAKQDSMTRMAVGVDEKQLVANLCTLCKKVLSIGKEPTLGVKRSTPYRRRGATSEVASLWHR